MVTPHGVLYSREAILENLLAQKKAIKKRMAAWEAAQAADAKKVCGTDCAQPGPCSQLLSLLLRVLFYRGALEENGGPAKPGGGETHRGSVWERVVPRLLRHRQHQQLCSGLSGGKGGSAPSSRTVLMSAAKRLSEAGASW